MAARLHAESGRGAGVMTHDPKSRQSFRIEQVVQSAEKNWAGGLLPRLPVLQPAATERAPFGSWSGFAARQAENLHHARVLLLVIRGPCGRCQDIGLAGGG